MTAPGQTRLMLEMGTGASMRSGDYQTATLRAVEDATRHASLSFMRSLRIDPADLRVEMIVAAQEPDRVDLDAAAARVPYGQVTARAVKGGLDVEDLRRCTQPLS